MPEKAIPFRERDPVRHRLFPGIEDAVIARQWEGAKKSFPIVASYYLLMFADLLEFVPQKVKDEYTSKYDIRKIDDDDVGASPQKGCSISDCRLPREESGFDDYFGCVERCIP